MGTYEIQVLDDLADIVARLGSSMNESSPVNTVFFMGVPITLMGHIDGQLPDIPGVYLITRSNGDVVDVGETESLCRRISCHDRRPCWDRQCADRVWFHVVRDAAARLNVESRLRAAIRPVCGIR